MNKASHVRAIAVALTLLITGAARVPPAFAADDPRQIAQESQNRSSSKSETYEGILQSYDAAEKVTEKRWIFQRLGANGLSKSTIRFTAPAEVKGVVLLVANHTDRASDQWMWTPALERDRRIALQDRSTRFFGTDFSFEDLEERDVNQFDYAMLGEEAIDGVPCWKIQTTPKQTKSSQYTNSVVWFRKDNYAVARLESLIKGEVVRRLEYKGLKQVQGIWTSHELVMHDLRRKSRTRLVLDKVQYNVELKDADFTLEAIRR